MKLFDLAKIIRSKNAGPLYITFDLMFDSRENMEKVVSALTKEQISAAYDVPVEQIDIIPYDADIRKYAANALLPAKVKSVTVDETKHSLLVTVSSDQSRVALGRKAQNVRLAGKLIGWTVTLTQEEAKSSTSNTMEVKLQEAAADLAAQLEISEATARKFVDNGFITIDGVRAADPENLLEIEGIDKAEVDRAVANAGKNA